MEDDHFRYSSIANDEDKVISNRRSSFDSTLKTQAVNLKNVKELTIPQDKEIKLTKSFKPLKSFGKTQKFERLHNQTKYSGVSSPFLASDFRGLLITDYNEALNN